MLYLHYHKENFFFVLLYQSLVIICHRDNQILPVHSKLLVDDDVGLD